VSFRAENDQPVRRACQIVDIQSQKVGADTGIPGIEETLSIFQFMIEFHQKRKILMVHINMQERTVAKWIDFTDGEDYQHNDSRNKKSK